ncbi:sensor histidine kinase [Aquibacillus sediminis]|uniref:sensor histidine kinase n=1 Tax=Aquibacillus sediminis TaxID=2574734 RepID=UPI001109410B|nr:histidine kinase [Aquibacillus sediminis]
MIRIRTKLLIYFTTILFLFVLLFFVNEQSSQQVKELYDENLEHYFLLNEITKVTNQTFETVQIYAHEPLRENLSVYQESKDQLIQLHQLFQADINGFGIEKNISNMIRSFLEQTDQIVEGVKQQDIEQYSSYVNEADKTSSYIHDQTLDFMNKELTNYHTVSNLIEKKISAMNKMESAIIISIIIISILFALWFSNGITRVIEQLTRSAEEISTGFYSGEDVVVSRKDELWFLTKTFNQMKTSIRKSVAEMKDKARLAQLVKEMELKSLQNQINPHFLFNTLNTISKTSYIEGAERTSDLITSISTLLRYNIGSLDRETLLKDEVEIVKEYFFIQKTRFAERVKFISNVDPACLTVPIPCLTLQPIVENAFIHGIEDMAEDAEIEIMIYEENEMVRIDVKDNGKGMDQQTIDRLLDTTEEGDVFTVKQSTGHSTGIGMKNVINRLQLFDKGSKVTISSQLGKGTTVSIQINKTTKNGGI